MAEGRFFVYGSMLRGEPNHGELAGSELAYAGRTKDGFAIVELPGMAGLVEASEGSVVGEVYVIDQALLLRLMAQRRHPGVFAITRIELADGIFAETFSLSEAQARGKRRIAGGDYRQRFAPRQAASEAGGPLVRWARGRFR